MFKNKYFNLSISTFTYYISISVALSIFPLILRDAGENMFFIGISNAMQRLAGLSFLLFVPYLVHKIGLKLLSVIIIALYTIPLALMPFYINYKFWLVLVALFGIGVRGFTTFLYSTINITATDEKRGLVNGIMNVVCLLAMSAMPVIFYFTSNYVIFAICIVLNILNLFSFLQLENEYKNITFIKNIKIVTFLRENILLYISKFSFEFIKTTLFVFTIIYANQNGWRDKEAGLL
ncbi:MAG: MFS transporter, partial [Rickettsiales bacterium]|nr:MFS transporter [Rickettsiales bacterium]